MMMTQRNAGWGALMMVAALGACATGSEGPANTGGDGTSSPGGEDEKPTCLTVACDGDARCAESELGPVCICKDGFDGNGKTCLDIDECASGSAACDPMATCENTHGGYKCTCKDGYGGDGKACVKLDDCQEAASCDPNASCESASGVYTCICRPGFTGNGKTCTDINECTLGMTACHKHATCKNIPGGYACACETGYSGNGTTCIRDDECLQGGGCDPNATCAATAEGHTCTCKEGYTGDGLTCADIDECTLGMAACDANADCKNTGGAYACACKSGYIGDGFTCTPAEQGAPGEVAIEAGAGVTGVTSVTLYLQAPGNGLQNPGAESGDLSGWQILANSGDGWAASTSAHIFGQRAFLTSYVLNKRSQLLDLTKLGFTQAALDAAPPITVGEWFQGFGQTFNDTYYLKVELRTADSKVLASLNPGGTVSTTSSAWQIATQTFTGYGPGLRYVYVEDGGRDSENWAGQYGAAMDGASVVVGDVKVRFSNDKTTWSAWQDFKPTMAWTLEPGLGTKIVYVEFEDAKGTVWPPVSDTILLQ